MKFAALVGASHAKMIVYGPVRPPEVGCGVSSAVRAFVSSRVQEVFDVEVVSTFRPHRERRLPERLAFGVWLVFRTVAQMIRSRAVLADIHAVSDRSLLSHAAVMFGVRLVGRPALLRIHGGDFHCVFEQASGLKRLVIRFILRRATRVVVLSEIWRSRIAAIEPRAAIEVLPNPVDCQAYSHFALRTTRACRRILFLANFCERKGHFDALEAIRRLAPEFPDLRLALGGEDRDPGTRRQLERAAGEQGILDRIDFLGSVSGAAKDEAFRDADILILPSHQENMPVSVMEGMAAALPVVATRVGAVGEMIDDGRTGFLIDAKDPAALADRLARLCHDPELARRLGREAQRYAIATWDADVVADANLALFTRLIGGDPSRSPTRHSNV